jgi:hypothetical protein
MVQPTLPENLSFVEYIDARKLTGSSLNPALLSGDQLLFLGGYYKCNPINYGDLALYRWGDNKNVAKFVRGLSGDQLAVEQISVNQWRLELNAQPLHNSLGDKSDGSHDSTVFGLVKTDQLAGKLVFLRHIQHP